MKSNVVAFVGFGVLSISVAFCFMIVRPALAQVDSASTSADTAASTSTSDTSTAITDTGSDTTMAATATTTDAPATTVESYSAPQSSPQTTDASTEPPPTGLTEIHIIGTRYTDYFTDGTTVTEYPGDPNVDSHLSEKDAPIPTHDGLVWAHTTGQYLYDTPSGDLEEGDYASQPNGTYIENAPPFVSSTSTAPVSDGTTPSDPTSDTTSTSSTDGSTAAEPASFTPAATDTTATTTS